MSEQDQAAETLLGYAGRRASRELLAAVIVAPYIMRFNDSNKSSAEKEASILACIKGALMHADSIMRISAENPPR